MKKIHLLFLFFSFNLCFSQGFQAPEYLCLGDKSFVILEKYKDLKSNEYVVFGKVNNADSLEIYVQKYNGQEKPVFEGCGRYLTTITTEIVNLPIGIPTFVRCITDSNDNIFVFLSVPNGVEGPYLTFYLHCYKLDLGGRSIWAKTGNELTASSIYIFLHDIEVTSDGDVHLIYQFSDFAKLGYIRISNEGNLRFQAKDFGEFKFYDLINPELNDGKKNALILKKN